MEALKLSEITRACGGECSSDAIISNVVIDNRKVTKGCLFVCIKGARFNGHDFVQDAVKSGAAAVLASQPVNAGIPVVTVGDTSKALLDLGGYYRSKFNIPVIGVTGSVGKTTTKEFIYLVVSSKYNTIKTLGNMNNEIGLPQMLFSIGNTTQAAVIEMGMNHFGEIHRLAKAAKPTVGVITNIGVSHIENLGSREGILKAKLEILDGMTENAPLLINSDNDLLSTVKTAGHPVVTFGIHSGFYRAFDITEGENSLSFIIKWQDKQQPITIPVIGIHNVYNALAAFTVGMELGVLPQDAADALAEYVPEGMRQKTVNVGGIMSIEDCYNASPDSMKAALNALKSTKANKRIAVLADMLELGDYSKQAHIDIGKTAGEYGVDYLLAYGSESKYYVEALEQNSSVTAMHFDNKDELAKELLKIACPGDAVVFKGSRGMKLEDVIHQVYDRWENK